MHFASFRQSSMNYKMYMGDVIRKIALIVCGVLVHNGFQRSDQVHIFKLLHGLHLQFFCLFPWRCLFALLLFRGIQLCPDASFLFLGKEKAAGFL